MRRTWHAYHCRFRKISARKNPYSCDIIILYYIGRASTIVTRRLILAFSFLSVCRKTSFDLAKVIKRELVHTLVFLFFFFHAPFIINISPPPLRPSVYIYIFCYIRTVRGNFSRVMYVMFFKNENIKSKKEYGNGYYTYTIYSSLQV